ncbi:hypothetical protein [Mycobacterium bourgelatii]|uniref:hypothetical protein n=1 Tax=Mycobacterium bourgelatii TaxID=1273442 RepID=UPI0019659D16|nr:hypothetical protein [Mycobacterium bourgelatii]MCV6974792.1 hypothetical protein [Mycobacterium bourgelatii]
MAAAQRARRWVTAVLASGGLALSGLGLTAGVAQAVPPPMPTLHWCPGDYWDPAWEDIYNWDWHACHDWPGAVWAGWGPWGPPPGWAPPRPPQPSWAPGAQLIYNPLENNWGFWNNNIWTPA